MTHTCNCDPEQGFIQSSSVYFLIITIQNANPFSMRTRFLTDPLSLQSTNTIQSNVYINMEVYIIHIYLHIRPSKSVFIRPLSTFISLSLTSIILFLIISLSYYYHHIRIILSYFHYIIIIKILSAIIIRIISLSIYNYHINNHHVLRLHIINVSLFITGK